MAAKVLSIEIDSSLTRVVEMDYKKNLTKVYQCFSFETPQGIINDGVISVSERFKRALNEKLSEKKIRTNKVVFSINSGRIANREVIIPMVKENKIQSLLTANSSEYFPVDLTEYQLFYRILEKIEDQRNKKLKVSVYAVPIEIIVSYQRLAEFLGMSIKSIDYMGNSVYQEMKKVFDKEQSAILKIEGESSVITIVKEGQIKLQRNIPYGVGGEAKADDIRYLIGNVSRVIDYYNAQNNESPLKDLWLAGMGAATPEFMKILGEELNINIAVLSKLADISITKEAAETFHASEYIACVGAILEPLSFHFQEHSIGKKLTVSDDSFRIPIIVAGTCVAISVGLVLSGAVRWMKLESDNRKLENRIEELQPAKEIYDIYNQVSVECKAARTMQSLTKTPNDALLTLFAEMEGKMPADMRLTGMSANLEGVIMTVTTADKESAAKVIMELREFTTVDNVTTTEIKEEEDETGVKKVTFTVNCTYRPVTDSSETSEGENKGE